MPGPALYKPDNFAIARRCFTLGATNETRAECATVLLAEKIGRQRAARLVEDALAKGDTFVEALGQLKRSSLTTRRCLVNSLKLSTACWPISNAVEAVSIWLGEVEADERDRACAAGTRDELLRSMVRYNFRARVFETTHVIPA